MMLMIEALNDLELQAVNIKNAYLTAPCREKIWTRAGPEFGMVEGKVFIVVRDLYGIHEEAAFAWWIPYVKRKRKAIISKLKSKYWQRTHKYEIKIPKYVKEAYKFDGDNGNTLFTDGIKEVMNKVRVADQESNVSPEKMFGHQEIGLHMIFDIKLYENFRRKARMVAGGHTTKTPSSVTYSSVLFLYLI